VSKLTLTTQLKAPVRCALKPLVNRLRAIGSSTLPWARICTSPLEALPKPAVVYLARRYEGLDVFKRFIASYKRFPDETPHDLIIIFKGFRAKESKQDYYRAIGSHPFLEMDKSDRGFDIGSFRQACERFCYQHYLFLGSFCRIACDNYLTKLLNCLRAAPGAGLVGPTGSWEQGVGPAFPNYHIRTSAFLIGREVLAKVYWPTIITKYDAYEFEHGSWGLTRQIMSMGLEPYAVRADGRWFRKESWPQGGMYRSGEQQGLMIADKQTDKFQAASRTERARLSALAWGTSLCGREAKPAAWHAKL
jgi:hypothetical protein